MSEWENFSREEFKCRHCGENRITFDYIDVAQDIRTESGCAMPVSSGYRCREHPIEAKKTAPGEHNEGTCADFAVSHKDAFAVLKAAMAHPKVTAIGVNQKGGKRFLHIGIGPAKPGRPRPHVWSY